MRLLTAAVLLLACSWIVSGQQALFDYINSPDPNYAYYDTGLRLGNATTGWTGYILNMTSQAWLLPSETDHPVWTHTLVVIVPHNLKHTNVSAIYVTGGGNDDGPPSASSEDVLVPAILAVESGTICATLFQVPNQPIVFTDDPQQQKRSEDALVAFSWYEYMKNTDRPEWVSLLPMVKSVVRAMDTIQDYTTKTGMANIQSFAIAGASKRGWTTWLTGAADKRVIAIMPIVMDLLNFQTNLLHMYQSYGGWTFAFGDYYAMNITEDFGTPGLAALSKIIDPLIYKDYLTMPKLVIDSTGDEFFMPDDDWLWWGQLEGETYRLMIQNAEHSMATGVIELLKGAQAFYDSIILQTARPHFNWNMDFTNGVITATTQQKPLKVMLRFATTFDDKRRDFRLVKGDTPADPCEFIPVHIFGEACINPVLWFGESIAPTSVVNGTYTYVATQPLPDKGWRGFFLEFFYPGPANSAYRLTTQVNIIPNTYPFPPCDQLPQGCKGVLV